MKSVLFSVWKFMKKTKFFPLALVLAIVLFLLLYPSKEEYDDVTKAYLVTDGTTTHLFHGISTEDMSFGIFHVEAATEEHDSRFFFDSGLSIVVRHGEDVMDAITEDETITNLLRRLRIDVEDDEMIAINLGGETPIVHVDSTLTYTHKECETVSYTSKYYPNYLLAYEEINTIQEGQDGEVITTYEDTYENGQLVGSTLISRTDSTATTKIVEYGTLVEEVDRDDVLKEVHYFHNSTGGYLVFTSGFSMKFTRADVCSATAYYGGTKTATGHATGIGIIAVDPKVYSYHSRMYIKCVYGDRAYGIGQAEDCGGAVKGHIIDVWFPTYEDCVSWGRRSVTCYILE